MSPERSQEQSCLSRMRKMRRTSWRLYWVTVMCSLEAVTLAPQLLRRLCVRAQLHRKRYRKKTVDKAVPNWMQEHGKEMLESFGVVCKRATESMEPTIGLEPMTC